MAEKTHGTSLCEQWNFSLSSVQFVGLILPSNTHAEIWTRLHAPAISSHNWPSEYALPPCLEWHVWPSSSGNDCHAVHRSLSSGASLCDGTVAFLPCPILSAKLYFTKLFWRLTVYKQKSELLLNWIVWKFVQRFEFSFKWPKKGWYAVKQNNHTTNGLHASKVTSSDLLFHPSSTNAIKRV